jgi:hypothetical protein
MTYLRHCKYVKVKLFLYLIKHYTKKANKAEACNILTSRKRATDTHYTEGQLGPRAGLSMATNKKHSNHENQTPVI